MGMLAMPSYKNHEYMNIVNTINSRRNPSPHCVTLHSRAKDLQYSTHVIMLALDYSATDTVNKGHTKMDMFQCPNSRTDALFASKRGQPDKMARPNVSIITRRFHSMQLQIAKFNTNNIDKEKKTLCSLGLVSVANNNVHNK